MKNAVGCALVVLLALCGATAWGQATLLGDLNPGPSTRNPDPDFFVEFNGQLYFRGNYALWATNGTVTGTALVDDTVSTLNNLCVWSGALYFSGHEYGVPTQLWKSNGLTGGSTAVTSFGVHGIGGITDIWPAGNRLFFHAVTATTGFELWVSDGTPAGTSLVADLNPGTPSTSLQLVTPLGNSLFFVLSTSTTGAEPWISDGTSAGTFMLRDINTGATASNVNVLGEVNGRLIFSANDGVNGNELWVTDGTAAGTVMLADTRAGATNISMTYYAFTGNRLYFAAASDTQGREFWISDGTPAGTVMLDINPGAGSSDPAALSVVGNDLYFRANDGTNGAELWRSQGTAGTTQMVHDICPGAASSSPGTVVSYGTEFFFSADDGTNGRELWRTDGTSAGTTLAFNLSAGSASTSFTLIISSGTYIFFHGTSSGNTGIYRSNGTLGGTQFLGPCGSSPEKVSAAGANMFFAAYDATNGRELWGTGGGAPALLGNFTPGSGGTWTSIDPVPFRIFGGNLVDVATVSGVSSLWISDGTVGGTQKAPLITSTADSAPTPTYEVGGYALFRATNGTDGYELWRTDGTPAGTQMVVNLHPTGDGFSTSFDPVVYGGEFYFRGDNGSGARLFKSDGTAAGTTMVGNVSPLLGGYSAEMGGYLYFSGGFRLWRTDGTSANTLQIGGTSPSSIAWMVATPSLVFMNANGPTGTELWVSDGTTAGTVSPLDINPSGSSGPANPQVVGNKVVFLADDGTNGRQAWVSDGTTAGTLRLTSITGTPSYSEFAVANGYVFFRVVNQGTNEFWSTDGTVAGTSLLLSQQVSLVTPVGNSVRFLTHTGGTVDVWQSDGTQAGTSMTVSLGTGGSVSSSTKLTAVIGNSWYFPASPTNAGQELWVSDGTAGGTFMLADAWPGTGGGLPGTALGVVGTRVCFAATSPAYGQELWITDGTQAGTRLLADLAPGTTWSSPKYGGALGSNILYWAYDLLAGTELWHVSLDFSPHVTLSVASANYDHNAGPVVLDALADVWDLDSADFDTGWLRVEITANATADDRIAIQNQGVGAGQIGVSGTDVTYGGTLIGTFSGGVGTTFLQVDLNAAATDVEVRALVRAIRFHNVAIAPSLLTRTVEFQMDDGDGNQGQPASMDVFVTSPAVQVALVAQPSGATSGAAFGGQPVVEVRDSNNQIDTTYVGTVTAAITGGPGGAVLLGTLTINVVAGTATFTNLRIDLAGVGHELTFTSGTLTAAVSQPFDVAAGAPASLVVIASPGIETAMVPFTIQPEVEIRDAFGNLRTQDNSTQVTVAIAGGTGTTGAILSGTLQATATSGVASFSGLSIDLPGTAYQLEFSSGGLASVQSPVFDVVAVPPGSLSIATQPGNGTAGVLLSSQPVIEVLDSGGSLDTADNSTQITAGIVAGTGGTGATLLGTLTRTANSGVVTFVDLQINLAAAGYQLEFSATGFATVPSAQFSVTAGAPSSLATIVQPSGATAGQPFSGQPQVAVRDAFGNTVTSDNTTQVSTSIDPLSGAPGAVMSGTTMATATNGVVTFAGLAIDLAGIAYVLDFTAPGLASSTSTSFDVVASGGGGGGGSGGGDAGGGCSANSTPDFCCAMAALLAAMLALRAGTRWRKSGHCPTRP